MFLSLSPQLAGSGLDWNNDTAQTIEFLYALNLPIDRIPLLDNS